MSPKRRNIQAAVAFVFAVALVFAGGVALNVFLNIDPPVHADRAAVPSMAADPIVAGEPLLFMPLGMERTVLEETEPEADAASFYGPKVSFGVRQGVRDAAVVAATTNTQDIEHVDRFVLQMAEAFVGSTLNTTGAAGGP